MATPRQGMSVLTIRLCFRPPTCKAAIAPVACLTAALKSCTRAIQYQVWWSMRFPDDLGYSMTSCGLPAE